MVESGSEDYRKRLSSVAHDLEEAKEKVSNGVKMLDYLGRWEMIQDLANLESEIESLIFSIHLILKETIKESQCQ